MVADKVEMSSREDFNVLQDMMTSIVNEYYEGKTNSLMTSERKFLRSELAHFSEKVFSHLQSCIVFSDEIREPEPVEVLLEPVDVDKERQVEVTAEKLQQALDRVKRLRDEVPEMATSIIKKNYATAEQDSNAQENSASVANAVPESYKSMADFAQSLIETEGRCTDMANIAKNLAEKLPSQVVRAQNITRVLKDRSLRKENITTAGSPTKETRGRLVRNLRYTPY